MNSNDIIIDDDEALTLEGVRARTFTGTPLAVLGHPVAHSISPPMHNAALADMAGRESRFADWRYHKIDVDPQQLPEALELLWGKGFFGLNLTVPHKVVAFPLVRRIDPEARAIGAVNTLRRQSDGFAGFNTDGYGLETGLQEDLGAGLAGSVVVLLGAGGAARGAAVEALNRGCRELWIGNRTRDNLDALVRNLSEIRPEIPRKTFTPSSPPALPRGAIIINATSAGLKSGDPPPLPDEALPDEARIYDMIYNPPTTPLLAAAAARGLPHANGLSMLVHQGVRSLEIWTESNVPAEVMRSAAIAALRRDKGKGP